MMLLGTSVFVRFNTLLVLYSNLYFLMWCYYSYCYYCYFAFIWLYHLLYGFFILVDLFIFIVTRTEIYFSIAN